MMGSRGALTGEEWDAFSPRSRPLLHWKPGEVRKLKRAFAKRIRRHAALQLHSQAMSPGEDDV